ATVDALPLAAGGDKRDSPPDRDRAGLGLGRAQAKLAELAAHEGPDVHLGIRMRLVLGVLAARHERGGPVKRLLEGCAAGKRVLEEGLAEPGEVTVVLAAEGGVGGVGGGDERRGVGLELVHEHARVAGRHQDRKSTRLNSSHSQRSYAVVGWEERRCGW